MATDIVGNEKVVYAEGDEVTFDMNGIVKGTGRVRGLATNALIDIWVVEYDPTNSAGIDPAVYPWSCIAVPHTLMKKI